MVYKTISYIFFINLSVVFFSSCSVKQSQILFDKKGSPDSIAATPVTPVTGASYKISPQDVLQLRNLQNIKYIVDDVSSGPSASGGGGAQGQTFQVEDDGNVALPVIGHVHIAGLTRAEAAKLIEDLYRKNLLKDPIIELKIINLKVTLLGEVKSQGNFPLVKDRTTLVDLIGQAGGLTEKANERNVKIIRTNHQKTEVTYIDLRDINSLTNPAIILQNNDVIVVAQNNRAVRTDELQNFSSIIQPALIVLNTALIIFTLIHR
jgi:polysaccharide export outer membrane protein